MSKLNCRRTKTELYSNWQNAQKNINTLQTCGHINFVISIGGPRADCPIKIKVNGSREEAVETTCGTQPVKSLKNWWYMTSFKYRIKYIRLCNRWHFAYSLDYNRYLLMVTRLFAKIIMLVWRRNKFTYRIQARIYWEGNYRYVAPSKMLK